MLGVSAYASPITSQHAEASVASSEQQYTVSVSVVGESFLDYGSFSVVFYDENNEVIQSDEPNTITCDEGSDINRALEGPIGSYYMKEIVVNGTSLGVNEESNYQYPLDFGYSIENLSGDMEIVFKPELFIRYKTVYCSANGPGVVKMYKNGTYVGTTTDNGFGNSVVSVVIDHDAKDEIMLEFIPDEGCQFSELHRGFYDADLEQEGSGITNAVNNNTYTIKYQTDEYSYSRMFAATFESVESSVVLNETNFPDATFRSYISNLTGVAEGEIISEEKLLSVRSIDVSGSSDAQGSITDLKGIEYFTALQYLSCGYNSLTSLDVSSNAALTYLFCGSNQLTSLDVSNNTALRSLSCYNNPLSILDVSKNTALTSLYCYNNQLTSLDVSNNTALIYLHCSGNQLTSLDVSNNTALTYLHCGGNQLTSLDVSNNTALTTLYCDNNKLTSLDVSHNTALIKLQCYNNQLTSLDVSNNTSLKELYCYGNQLTSLDVSNNTALTHLNCSSNQLTSLDVSNNTALTFFDCGDNKLTNLNVSNNTALTTLLCGYNKLTSLDVSNNIEVTMLECNYNQLTSLDVSNNAALTYLYCSNNQLIYCDASKCTNLRVGASDKQSVCLTATATGSNQYSIPIPSGFDISKVSAFKVKGVSTIPSAIDDELVFTAYDLNQHGDVLIKEIDWTQQDTYYNGVHSDGCTVTVHNGEGLVIESAPPSNADNSETEIPILAHIDFSEHGSYQLKFTVDAPASGIIQLSFNIVGVTLIGPLLSVEEGEHEYTVHLFNFPNVYGYNFSDTRLSYCCGKIPGRHVIKNVQIMKFDDSRVITYQYNTGNSALGTMDVELTIASIEEPNYDNTIYMDDVEVLSGTEAVLSVKMKNTVVAEGFEFDMYLPEGITVLQDEDGFPDVTLSTERTTARKTNSFDAIFNADGSLRVLAASTNGSAISGNDGEVVQVKVAIADDMAEGDYTACFKNIAISDVNATSHTSAMTTSTIKVNTYIIGDANTDKKVDVADFTAVAHHLLNNTPASFHQKAADANQDSKLDVADLTAIAHLILYGTVNKPTNTSGAKPFMLMADNLATENYIYIDPVSVKGQSEITLSVKMRNTVEAEGFEFDLYLPDGMSFVTDADGFAEASLSTERTNSRKTNNFDAVIQPDGSLRVLAASSNGSSISGNDGEVALVTIHIDPSLAAAEYPLLLKNIAIADVNAVSHSTDLKESMIIIPNNGITTDVEKVQSSKFNVQSDEWYSLDGKKLNSKPKAKGVYIMNGKKIMMK